MLHEWRRKYLKVFASYCHGSHLGHVNLTIYINFHYDIWLRLAKRFQRRRSLNIMVIYMYIAPGWGQTCSWGPFFFQNHKSSVHLPISIKFFPSHDILTIFPICNLCKIGQGHPRVMIYINFVELIPLMLHDKFQNHRPSGSGEEDF